MRAKTGIVTNSDGTRFFILLDDTAQNLQVLGTTVRNESYCIIVAQSRQQGSIAGSGPTL